MDERDRQPIGRPYLTIAIDVFTRCVVGMVVTLEAPSFVSVDLCFMHVGCDKRPWLEGLDVEMDWPMSGKPVLLYLDNAAEFKSEALRRGCEQHGIRLDYRPLGRSHYDDIVERIIDTAMQIDLQRDALIAAGFDASHFYEDHASGKREDRPGLAFCLKALRPGDTLVVWKLDRFRRDLRKTRS